MAGNSVPEVATHQTVRLGPGRHDGPGGAVCVMELASMLAGERFSDRPGSVCPIVGAVVRAYNDAVDDRRRQDLYRFAADAVGTRGDFSLQRRRAQAALDYARDRGAGLPAPELDAGPEEIADHVIGALARRPRSRSSRRRWDDASHHEMLSLLERLISTGAPLGGNPLLGEFVEHPPEAVEDLGCEHELLLAELGHGRPEAGLEFGAPGFDEVSASFGQGGQHHAPVAVGAGALHEGRLGETIEHLGDAGWTEVGGVGEFTGGSPLVALPQAEEQAVLGLAEHPGPALLPAAHPAKGGHRPFERPAELLGAVALLALACHAGRRFAERAA
jgi:hypothetical protein